MVYIAIDVERACISSVCIAAMNVSVAEWQNRAISTNAYKYARIRCITSSHHNAWTKIGYVSVCVLLPAAQERIYFWKNSNFCHSGQWDRNFVKNRIKFMRWKCDSAETNIQGRRQFYFNLSHQSTMYRIISKLVATIRIIFISSLNA